MTPPIVDIDELALQGIMDRAKEAEEQLFEAQKENLELRRQLAQPSGAKKSFPHVTAFLTDAEKVSFRWSFDEQQADPIHKGWTEKAFREELAELLKISARV